MKEAFRATKEMLRQAERRNWESNDDMASLVQEDDSIWTAILLVQALLFCFVFSPPLSFQKNICFPTNFPTKPLLCWFKRRLSFSWEKRVFSHQFPTKPANSHTCCGGRRGMSPCLGGFNQTQTVSNLLMPTLCPASLPFRERLARAVPAANADKALDWSRLAAAETTEALASDEASSLVEVNSGGHVSLLLLGWIFRL